MAVASEEAVAALLARSQPQLALQFLHPVVFRLALRPELHRRRGDPAPGPAKMLQKQICRRCNQPAARHPSEAKSPSSNAQAEDAEDAKGCGRQANCESMLQAADGDAAPLLLLLLLLQLRRCNAPQRVGRIPSHDGYR